MNNLSMIAAVGKNNELGVDNHLIWQLRGDMHFFKTITFGKTIIMGRKCFESLPKMLPNRKHIILTNNKDYNIDHAIVFHNVLDVIKYVDESSEECFIIGGAKIYEEFLPYVLNIYLTEIDASAVADVYFPPFDKKEYNKEILEEKEENNIKYKICLYKRKINCKNF